MKVHANVTAILLTVLVCMAFGCKSESTPRSTMELTMEMLGENEKLIVPSDTSLEISKYLINGRGPDSETFSVVSTKQTTSISGLLIGSWSVTVDGMNASGNRLASGNATIQLGPEPTPQTIYLDTLEGTGAALIQIQWNSDLIADPSVTLDLTSQNGGTTLRQILDTSTLSSGYINWSTNSLEAGSYMLTGKLYAGSVLVSGFVEALRIVDGLTAESTITLDLEKTTSIPATISLVDTVGEPIACSITGLSEQMETGEEVTATIEPAPGGEVNLSWYQDGESVGTGLSYSFTPSLGNHRLDVLAQGTGKASLGSASFTYEGTLSGETGVPVAMGKIEDADGQLKAPKGSQVAFLPDGNVLVAGGGYIQICKLIRGKAVVVQSYSASNASAWPLTGISDVAVDSSRNLVFIADNVNKNLWAFSYDTETKKLTKVRTSDNLTYSASSGDYRIKETGRLKIDVGRGIVYLSLVDDANRIFSLSYREEPASGETFRISLPLCYGSDTYEPTDTQSFTPQFWRTAISDDGEYLVGLDTHNLLIWSTHNNAQSLGLGPLPIGLLCYNESYRENKVHDIAILSKNNVIATSEGGVFLLYGDLSKSSSSSIANWSLKQSVAEGEITLSDGTKATFEDMENLYMCELNAICYGMCTTSNSILSMARGDDGKLLFKGSVSLDGFAPTEMAVSEDGKTMVVASDTSDGLMLLMAP